MRSVVLIESDWNLKLYFKSSINGTGIVLIESDWNLKIDKTKMAFTTASVLIESDWNLKLQDKAEPCGQDGQRYASSAGASEQVVRIRGL